MIDDQQRAQATAVAIETIAREGHYLDSRDWDAWLALYAKDCVYWVPTWVTEDRLANDPQRELSQIYYADRNGLEDRIARIRTHKSPASTPLRRTTHMASNVLVTAVGDGELQATTSWLCHVFDPNTKGIYTLFGSADYTLRTIAGEWKIGRKKIIINNDYLPSMVDVYCL